MITLREDKFIFDIPLKDIIDIDIKVNILECFRLINMKVSSRYTKDELAEIYDMFFHKDTGWVLNKIPIVEWPTRKKILGIFIWVTISVQSLKKHSQVQ